MPTQCEQPAELHGGFELNSCKSFRQPCWLVETFQKTVPSAMQRLDGAERFSPDECVQARGRARLPEPRGSVYGHQGSFGATEVLEMAQSTVRGSGEGWASPGLRGL